MRIRETHKKKNETMRMIIGGRHNKDKNKRKTIKIRTRWGNRNMNKRKK